MGKSVYEMVTDRIISQLEEGIIPWQKPWTGVMSGAYNRVSKKPYSLLNQMMLLHDGEYASFKQWQDLGGHVKKGAKSEIIVFWKVLPVEETKEDGSKAMKNIPYLRYINVFHVSQVEGVEPLRREELKETELIEAAQELLDQYIIREGIELIQEASNKAYYSPDMDMIHLPLMEQFQNAEEYYSTAFHESVHSTMKECRCNREQDRKGKNVAFGSQDYSKEELVAEIGSAHILNQLGIETAKSFKNSAAYIQSWLKVLKGDVKFIVSASSKAEKAVKYILGEEIEASV